MILNQENKKDLHRFPYSMTTLVPRSVYHFSTFVKTIFHVDFITPKSPTHTCSADTPISISISIYRLADTSCPMMPQVQDTKTICEQNNSSVVLGTHVHCALFLSIFSFVLAK